MSNELALIEEVSFIEAIRVKNQLDNLTNFRNDTELSSRQWWQEGTAYVSFWSEIERESAINTGLWLYVMEERWQDIDFEPETEEAWETFPDFAEHITKKRWKTLENWIRMAKTYILHDKLPANPIEVTKRDSAGEPLTREVDGVEIVETEEITITLPNIMETSHSKLILMRSRVEDGEMTPELWGMLINPNVSFESIRREAMGVGNGTTINNTYVLLMETGFLVAKEGPKEIILIDNHGFNHQLLRGEIGTDEERLFATRVITRMLQSIGTHNIDILTNL